MQWGYNNTSSAATIYFPIAFPSACYSVVLGGYRQCTGNQRATSITKTSFYLGGDSASDAQYSRWMAVGSQQWGYNSNNAAGATTGFPISFTSACYGVVHCSGNTGRVEGNPYISSLTKSQINWGQYGLGYWIAFGL